MCPGSREVAKIEYDGLFHKTKLHLLTLKNTHYRIPGTPRQMGERIWERERGVGGGGGEVHGVEQG